MDEIGRTKEDNRPRFRWPKDDILTFYVLFLLRFLATMTYELPPSPAPPTPILVHPGYVYTGFGGIGAPKRPGQRDVDESTRGVIEAIEKTTLTTTGSFFHGNYGEGVRTLPW